MNNDINELVNVILNISKHSIKNSYLTDIYIGTVQTTNPLNIKIDTPELILTEKSIILSPFCKKRVIKHTHYHTFIHTHQYYDQDIDACGGEGASGHDRSTNRTTISQTTNNTSNEIPNNYQYIQHQITNPPEIILWDDLQIGEQVLLLKCGMGQKFYCLQRLEEQNV